MLKPKVYPFQSKTEFVTVLVVVAEVGSTATVYRQYGGNQPEVVRGALDVKVTRDEQLFIDYEVPQDYEMTYWVVSKAGEESADSAPKRIGPYNFGGDVIFDLADPKRGMVINVESLPTLQRQISRDVQRVWGRPDPVVISGVREMPTGTLNLLTLNLDERDNLLSIIQNGSTIAFAPHKRDYGLPGLMYLAVGNVSESRVTNLARESTRRWALEVQEVTPPPASYRYPNYGKTWRELREQNWRAYMDDQWWEAIA
jgi:hypothetical protein